MNHLWRHRLRRMRFLLWGLLALLPIMLAVSMALGQLLLPLVAHYPQRVAHYLSQRLQRPVGFASMDGYWQPSGPLLVLHDVSIGVPGKGRALRLPTAEVKVDFGALLWPSRHWVNLRLSGMKLDLRRDTDGTWHVAGFGSAGQGAPSMSLQDLPGNLLLDDLSLGISDARSGRHYGLQVSPLRISNDGQQLRFAGLLRRVVHGSAVRVAGQFDADGRAGRLYINGRDLDLGAWSRDIRVGAYAFLGGKGSASLWLDWRDARPVGMSARFDIKGLDVAGPGGAVKLPVLRALLQYRRDAAGMQVLYAGQNGSAARATVTQADGHTDIVARAHDVDLGMVLPLASLLPQAPPATARWLAAAHAHGTLHRVDLRWRKGEGIQALDADFSNVGFAAVGKHPGIDHLSGKVNGDAEALQLDLPRQPVVLDFAHRFRKPIALSALSGSLVAWHDDAAWHVGTDALDFTATNISGQARGQIRLADAGGAPFVDIYATGHLDDITAAKQFWPDSMPDSTVHWLDRGLVSGQLQRADMVLHGNLADWPFREHQGRFEARGVIAGLVLNYGPEWPRAKGVNAVASFVDSSMQVEADAGQASGVHVRRVVANIPDFGDPQLLLSVQGYGQGSSLFDFVRSSPILADSRQAVRHLGVRGNGEFGFNLALPLTDPPGFTLDGNVVLTNTVVSNTDWDLRLDKLRGQLDFDKHGFDAAHLRTVFRGQPANLSMAVGGATGNPAQRLKASLRGHFSVAQLVQGQDSLAALADVAKGQADFNIGFVIADAPGTGTATTAMVAPAVAGSAATAATPVRVPPTVRQTLSIDSNLKGIALQLPVPLDKAADASLPLHLQLGVPYAGNALRLSLGDLLHARARLPSATGGPWAASIVLGQAGAASLPAQGLSITGRARRLDVSGWIQRALAMQGSNGGGLRRASIDTDVAEVFGKRFRDLHLEFQPGTRQAVLKVNSAQMRGTLTLPANNLATRGVLARFQRLYWPDEKVAASPGPAAVTTADDHPEVTGINPSQLPPLHLWVGDLRLGKAHLGEARFESWPTSKGMHIDQLRTQSGSIDVSGAGEWDGNPQDSHTHMVIDFSAENLGRMLDALGYAGLFNGGKTHAHLDATWPGAPSSLAMANMDGSLSVDVGKGRIPEVAPGMGRLFGLMSVAELPRRLSLDFGDVFGKGFGFDSIKGSFRLADGNANTDNLVIKGPAAEITIKGRTGLRAHDYDQRVLVMPHVGSSLPVVGAVVAGPIGAAAGLAVQGILGKGLSRAASARYRISGSWDKPVITLLEKKNLPPPPKLVPTRSATKAPAPTIPGASPGLPASASSR